MPLYLKDKLVSGTGTPGKSAYQTAVEAGYIGTETAFNKALTDMSGHISNKDNPHSVTAAQVGARPDTWMPSASDVGAYTKTEADTLLQKKENSFSVLPINKGGTGATGLGAVRANLGIDKVVPCSVSSSITLTLQQNNIYLIGTSDNARIGGLIIVDTGNAGIVTRVSEIQNLNGWSYSLSNNVLTLSETDGRYDVAFSVVTLSSRHSEVYS